MGTSVYSRPCPIPAEVLLKVNYRPGTGKFQDIFTPYGPTLICRHQYISSHLTFDCRRKHLEEIVVEKLELEMNSGLSDGRNSYCSGCCPSV